MRLERRETESQPAVLLAWLLVVILAFAGAYSISASEAPPAWVLEEMRRTEGRWIADNSAHKSDDEPYDAYGLEWRSATAGRTLIGRLFAIQDGEELGTLWEYRMFWHPERGSLWLIQFGTDGTVGEGEIERTGPDSTEVDQTFYSPGGTTWRSGHRDRKGEDRKVIQSFAIDADGSWKLQREYTWVKQD